MEIVLEGPGKNALSSELMDGLIDRLRQASGGPILLTGAGDAFSAGLDLKELATLEPDAIVDFLHRFEALVETLYTYPGPTVAWVNGHAIAGGCVLALCCDHQVAAARPELNIGLNEVALGLQFPPVTLGVVRERIPKRHLNQVVLGGQLHDPASALRLGLVDEISPDAGLVARKRLELLASYPAAVFAATKAAIREEALDASRNERLLNDILPAWKSPELRRRLEALLGKGRPG